MTVRAFLRVCDLALVDLHRIAAGVGCSAAEGDVICAITITATAANDATVHLDTSIVTCDQFLTANTHKDPPVGTLASRSSAGE